jgi:signal transduction histidine kinase
MLLEAGLALSSELSLSVVLQRITELAAEITGARYGALGVLGPDRRIAEFLTTGITQEQRRAIGDLPVGHGILGVLIGDAEPLRLRDISEHPQSVGFPPNHPPMRSFLGAPVKARGRVFGNIYLTEKQGAEEFSAEDEENLVVLATQAAVAVENARLYEEARQRERRLEAVREIVTKILDQTEPEEALELVARRARELVDADLATIAIPDPEGGSLVLTVAVGENADQIRGMVFPMKGSVSGEVIRSGKPILLADASAEGGAHQPIAWLGVMGPAMLVPLAAGDRPLGTLAVANRKGGMLFDDAALELVKTLAGQASVVVEYERVQSELRRLAVMEDRERIAKELHDGAIQSLFAVGMGLQATGTLSGDPDIEERIEGAVNEIDRVIRDLRNYIFGLRPGILADRQLAQAIRHLAEDFQQKTGVTIVVEIDGAVASELTSRAGDVVQLAREALSNVGRHAAASTCRVSLARSDDGSALLEIDDDGRGFDPRAAIGTGHGLGNLEERAASMGGKLNVESAVGQGTTIRVSIPF